MLSEIDMCDFFIGLGALILIIVYWKAEIIEIIKAVKK